MPVNYPGTEEDAQAEADAHFALKTIEKLQKLTPMAMKWKYSGVTGPGPGEPRCQSFHGWPDQGDPHGGKVAVIHVWYEEPDLCPITGDERANGWGAGIDMPLGQPMFPVGCEGRKTVDQALTALLDAVNRTFIEVSMRITQTVEGLLNALPRVVLSGMLSPWMEGKSLSKARFVEEFVISFLAAWAQSHHESACLRGEAGIYMQGAPVEDARKLAEQAWELAQEKR